MMPFAARFKIAERFAIELADRFGGYLITDSILLSKCVNKEPGLYAAITKIPLIKKLSRVINHSLHLRDKF